METAGWIALAATCVAAIMTASNLSVRITGWGFVVFTAGAAAWICVGFLTHHTQLLYSNIFLAVVDVFGIWHWLGRRARISDTSRAEEQRSERQLGETLLSTAKLDGLSVMSCDVEMVAKSVDALAACAGEQIDYLIVRVGGIGGVGETLRRLPWSAARVGDEKITTALSVTEIEALPLATAG